MSDGVTHINIYSRAKTCLGRGLSNFSHTPIETVDGTFQSIEGYWYWLGCSHVNKDQLRYVHGGMAKALGRELKSKDWKDEPLFKLKIYNAMLTKLILHDTILQDFLKNSLPFRHYYIYNSKIIEPKEGKWIIEMWEFLKTQLCK